MTTHRIILEKRVLNREHGSQLTGTIYGTGVIPDRESIIPVEKEGEYIAITPAWNRGALFFGEENHEAYHTAKIIAMVTSRIHIGFEGDERVFMETLETKERVSIKAITDTEAAISFVSFSDANFFKVIVRNEEAMERIAEKLKKEGCNIQKFIEEDMIKVILPKEGMTAVLAMDTCKYLFLNEKDERKTIEAMPGIQVDKRIAAMITG